MDQVVMMPLFVNWPPICSTDNNVFHLWVSVVVLHNSICYNILANFLIKCVEECHAALNKHKGCSPLVSDGMRISNSLFGCRQEMTGTLLCNNPPTGSHCPWKWRVNWSNWFNRQPVDMGDEEASGPNPCTGLLELAQQVGGKIIKVRKVPALQSRPV